MIDPIENPPAVNPMLGNESFSEMVEAPMVNQNPLKTQAAMLAMLQKSDEDALAAYQRMRSRPEDATQNLVAEIQSNASRSLAEMKAGLPDLLSDPTVPYQDKERAVTSLRDGTAVAPDSAVAVGQKAALKNSKFFDDKGVYDIAAFWKEKENEWGERQAVVNSVVASKDGTFDKVANFVGLFAPLADANVTRQLQESDIAKELGMGGKAYALLAPGSFMQEMNKKLNELPFEKKTEALKGLVEIIRNSSSLATSDNNMRAMGFMSDLNSNEFSNMDKWLMNAGNVLDMLGLPALAKGTVTAVAKGPAMLKAAKAAKEAERAADFTKRGKDFTLEADIVKADYDVPYAGAKGGVVPDDLASVKSTPQRSANQERIEALEGQKASILEEPTEPLTKGQVTRIEADIEKLERNIAAARSGMTTDGKKGGTSLALKKTHEGMVEDMIARKGRLEDSLQTNRIAENNLQVIADIDKEITAMRKADTVVDIPVNDITSAFRQAYAQGTLYTHNPRTVSNVLMQTNPAEARKIHTAVLMDESDEAAIALTGTTRNEALVQAVAPQVSLDGRVRWTAPDPERHLREMILSQDATAVISSADGGLRYTAREIEKGRANIVRDYTEVEGLSLHPSMSSIQTSEDGISFSVQGVYTKGDEPWTSAEDAVAQAKYALRHRGVTDEDITILARQGDDFVPVDKAAVVGKPGEYLVGLRTKEMVHDGDIGPLDALDVKWNWMDRLQRTGDNKHGSIQSHILPSANMLHEVLTGSATVAVDRTSVLAEALLEQLDRVTTPLMALSKDRRAIIND